MTLIGRTLMPRGGRCNRTDLPRSWSPPMRSAEVDAYVQVEVLGQEVFEFAAFDDPQSVVADGEGFSFGADPGRGDQDAAVGPFFFDRPGQGADVVGGDALAVPRRSRARTGSWVDSAAWLSARAMDLRYSTGGHIPRLVEALLAGRGWIRRLSALGRPRRNVVRSASVRASASSTVSSSRVWAPGRARTTL